MNKMYFLLTAIFIMAMSPLMAQIYLGPKAGFNLTNAKYDLDNIRAADSKAIGLGFNGGIYFSQKLSDHFDYQVEINFSRKTRRVKIDDQLDVDNRIFLSFIDVPYMIRYSYGSDIQRYFIGFGPQLSYWLGGSGTLRGETLDEFNLTKLKYDIRFKENPDDTNALLVVNDPNRFNLGLVMMAGGHFRVSDLNRVYIDVRLELNNSLLSENEFQEFFGVYRDSFRVNNRTLSINIAYFFDVKGLLRKY